MIIPFLFLAVAGCHLKPSPHLGLRAVQLASAAECDALDRRVVGLTASSVLGGALGAGGSALAPLFDSNAPKYGVGGAGAVLSSFSALTAYLASYYSKRYADRCTFNVGGTP